MIIITITVRAGGRWREFVATPQTPQRQGDPINQALHTVKALWQGAAMWMWEHTHTQRQHPGPASAAITVVVFGDQRTFAAESGTATTSEAQQLLARVRRQATGWLQDLRLTRRAQLERR